MHPKELITKWSIPTDFLTASRRGGGSISLRGFKFQEAYACLQLACLLNNKRGLRAVRYEGAQDVDLLLINGEEKYVQIKNEPNATYTIKKLAPILRSFAVDLKLSSHNASLMFELVARSNHTDAAVKRLIKKKPTDADLDEVAYALSELDSTAPHSGQFINTSDVDGRYLASRLINQTTFRFGMGDEFEGRLSFESHACAELAQQGIASADLGSALEALQAALKPQCTFTAIDVREILKRLIGITAVDIFDGRVEVLSDDLLSRASSRQEVLDFYEGKRLLDWSIIAASGDIPRHQQSEIVQYLNPPSDTLRFVCLLGEPGAGKSTLARRLATELHGRFGALVFRVKEKDNADLWYLMPRLWAQVRRPFYVLADDLFRDANVGSSLRELDSSLPITILATSRYNEYQCGALSRLITAVSLAKPDAQEKAEILARLGKSQTDLTPSERQRLDAAEQFLVLMMEATEGKELREIVRDTLDRLKQACEPVYRAYEYLCFSSSCGVSMPESVLEQLDPLGRFYQLSNTRAARGIIFTDEARPRFLRAAHPLLAETALSFYARNTAFLLQEIAKAIDSSIAEHRRFMVAIVSAFARTKPDELRDAWPLIRPIVEASLAKCTISELNSWRSVYRHLGKDAGVEKCMDLALNLTPGDSADCNSLLSIFRERGRERDALPILAEWVSRSLDSPQDRSAYLMLTQRYASTEAQQQAIDDTAEWLTRHADDPYVKTTRPAYLSLVEHKGKPAQVEAALQETRLWLNWNVNDTYVRTRALGLVERRGTRAQVVQIVEQTREWLTEHVDDTAVRQNYLGLMARKIHDDQQVDTALEETRNWLVLHDSDSTVRTAFLGLVQERGSRAQIKRALYETSSWLDTHDESIFVRNAWLRLIEREAKSEDVDHVLEKTQAWLQRHPDDTWVRAAYLSVLESKGTEEHCKRAIADTENWLREHDADSAVRIVLLGITQRIGTDQQVQRALLEMKDWLQRHPTSEEGWKALLASLFRLGKADDAANLVEQAILHNPNHRDLTTQYIRFLKTEKDAEQVKTAYTRLISDFPEKTDIRRHFADWLREHEYLDEARELYRALMEIEPDDYRLLYAYGRLLLKEKNFRGALAEFQKALKLCPDHQAAHQGLGHSLRGLGEMAEQQGQHEHASRFFSHAEQQYRRAIKFANEKEHPHGRFYGDLGWFYIARGRYAAARAAFDLALAEVPDYWEYHWGAGQALVELQQFRLAADSLLTAMENSPNDLLPPASDALPSLYTRCVEALRENNRDTIVGAS